MLSSNLPAKLWREEKYENILCVLKYRLKYRCVPVLFYPFNFPSCWLGILQNFSKIFCEEKTNGIPTNIQIFFLPVRAKMHLVRLPQFVVSLPFCIFNNSIYIVYTKQGNGTCVNKRWAFMILCAHYFFNLSLNRWFLTAQRSILLIVFCLG